MCVLSLVCLAGQKLERDKCIHSLKYSVLVFSRLARRPEVREREGACLLRVSSPTRSSGDIVLVYSVLARWPEAREIVHVLSGLARRPEPQKRQYWSSLH